MSFIRSLFLMLGLAVVVGAVTPAAAAPVSPGVTKAPAASVLSILEDEGVTKVHRCNRRCRWGYVPRWGYRAMHRHVGPRCRPRSCGRRFYRPPPGWRGRGCVAVGPVWVCP